MNRVIVANEDIMIRGNTVLAPSQVPYVNREKEKNQIIKKKNRKIKKQAIFIRNIFIAFIIGLTLIGRYSTIYNMQQQLNSTKSNINEMNKENDNLKVELVKYNNLHYIEEVATNKLHMITPNRNDAIYANISKNTIVSTTASTNTEANKSFMSKAIDKIF